MLFRSASSGTLIWEGQVNKVLIVTIDNNVPDSGRLTGSLLPSVPLIIQPLDEKKVSIASSPGPRNEYQRLVIRVTGKGLTRAVLKWSLP